MKKIKLLTTTVVLITLLAACSETKENSTSKSSEISKTSSSPSRELEKSEGTAKIQPAKDFSNTPVGEYKLADTNLYGAWPDNTKLVIDDSVVQVVDPSTVFTKYLIYLNKKENNPVILKIFLDDTEKFDVTKVSKFYVRANGTHLYKGKEIPLFLVDGFEY
jgi:lipoprotein